MATETATATATAPTEPGEADFLEIEEEEAAVEEAAAETSPTSAVEETGELTSMGGMNTLPTEIAGEDNSIRLLMREGRIFGLLTTCIDSSTLSLVFTRFHQVLLAKFPPVYARRCANLKELKGKMSFWWLETEWDGVSRTKYS